MESRPNDKWEVWRLHRSYEDKVSHTDVSEQLKQKLNQASEAGFHVAHVFVLNSNVHMVLAERSATLEAFEDLRKEFRLAFEMDKIKIRMEAMLQANEERIQLREAPAYDEANFMMLVEEMKRKQKEVYGEPFHVGIDFSPHPARVIQFPNRGKRSDDDTEGNSSNEKGSSGDQETKSETSEQPSE